LWNITEGWWDLESASSDELRAFANMVKNIYPDEREWLENGCCKTQTKQETSDRH